jgi:cell pole-organizing protein PopZ
VNRCGGVKKRKKPMNESTNNPASVEDKMKSVKAVWDKAPAGPKKEAALKPYQAAEVARTAKNDANCIRELDAATLALS